jgi:hypothetical protein
MRDHQINMLKLLVTLSLSTHQFLGVADSFYFYAQVASDSQIVGKAYIIDESD